MELSEPHYCVLWFAHEGDQTSAPVRGEGAWVGGELVSLVRPLSVEEARRAALELIDAGCLEVYGETNESSDALSSADARSVFEDPAYPEWPRSSLRQYQVFELGLTPAGEKLWLEAERRFGAEARRLRKLSHEEFSAFLARHPDFEERRQAYFDALRQWVDHGGERPEWPWKYPDWPYPEER